MEENKKSRWHSKKKKLKKSSSRKCHNVYLYQQMEYALLFYCFLFCYVIFLFKRTSQENHLRIVAWELFAGNFNTL